MLFQKTFVSWLLVGEDKVIDEPTKEKIEKIKKMTKDEISEYMKTLPQELLAKTVDVDEIIKSHLRVMEEAAQVLDIPRNMYILRLYNLVTSYTYFSVPYNIIKELDEFMESTGQKRYIEDYERKDDDNKD